MLTVLLSITLVNPQPSILRWHNPLLERTYWAVRQVESSGGRDRRDGDGGRAVGELQIQKGYVDDVNRILGCRTFSYEDRRNPALARTMFRIYVLHYWPKGGPEQWARCHNGGPAGPQNAATLTYWGKVQKAMR